jgi:hypothetical protein
MTPPTISKCSHISITATSETKCRCPMFAQRDTPGDGEGNICNGCLHTVSWHIDHEQSVSPTPNQSANAQVETILSSYKAESWVGGPSNSSSSSGRISQLKISENDARKEAISGLKRNSESDEESHSKVP